MDSTLEEITLTPEQYKELPTKLKVCDILCERLPSADCPHDMGDKCTKLDESFDELALQEEVEAYDEDDWEAEPEKKEEDEPECTDIDIVLDNKKKP